jgi:fatty acid desaturase
MLDLLPVADDYSRTFSALRAKLVGSGGAQYADFLRSLRPRYFIVYRDLGIGYLLLGLSYALTAVAPAWVVPPLAASIVGAVLIGFWVAYLQLFIHEGAHYNLAPTKRQSDRVCDLGVSWMIGTTVAAYRPIHFQHHRDLGMTTDTESTYFFPLNLAFLLKGAFGILAAQVVLKRLTSAPMPHKPTKEGKTRKGLPILLGVTVHCIILAASLLAGWWWAALGWVLGIGLVFPLFGAVRQLLEHRSDAANPGVDYRVRDHGAYTRLFGSGPFSAAFGGAGFNRHLLHHWEPQVSYTNLPELEAFLEGTEAKAIMDGRRSTYFRTFRRLLAQQ